MVLTLFKFSFYIEHHMARWHTSMQSLGTVHKWLQSSCEGGGNLPSNAG